MVNLLQRPNFKPHPKHTSPPSKHKYLFTSLKFSHTHINSKFMNISLLSVYALLYLLTWQHTHCRIRMH